jgi:hypothetical protein
MTNDLILDPIIKHKYLKLCAGSVQVKIERGDDVYLRHFSLRNYPSLEATVDEAIKWRDKTHMEKYGFPVSQKIHQVTRKQKKPPRTNPDTGEILPILSPGLSYGWHKGRLRYVVSSHQVNGRPKRVRFSISEHGLQGAIRKAEEKRLDTLKSYD